MKRIRLITAFLVGIFLVSSIVCCDNTVNESDSGSQINLSVGNHFIVKLDSNHTTGYSWNLSEISNTSIITKVSNSYTEYPHPRGGGGWSGYEKWTFQTLSVGTATLYMKYCRCEGGFLKRWRLSISR